MDADRLSNVAIDERALTQGAGRGGTLSIPGGGRTAADAIVERRRPRKVRAP